MSPNLDGKYKKEFEQSVQKILQDSVSVIVPTEENGQLKFFSESEFWSLFAPPPIPDNEYLISIPALGDMKFRIYAPNEYWAKQKAASMFLVGPSFIKIHNLTGEGENADSTQE